MAKRVKVEKVSTPKTKAVGILAVKTIKNLTMAKGDKHEGIQVCDLNVSILEMKKHYEVHFIFENSQNIDNRMDTAINYLGMEGFFNDRKRIKATAVHISDGYPSDNPNE